MESEIETLEIRRMLSVEFGNGIADASSSPVAETIDVYIGEDTVWASGLEQNADPYIHEGYVEYLVIGSDFADILRVHVESSDVTTVFIEVQGGSGDVTDIIEIDGYPVDGGASLYGGEGGDSIDGEDFAIGFRAEGGLGEDYIYGGPANDTLLGGDVTDLLENNDVVRDDIFGNGGDDNIAGGGGGDLLMGGTDEDNIAGGSGSDTIWGDSENDKLYGGDDNDTLYGGDGDDELTGDGGFDKMYGQEHDDIIWAWDGIVNEIVDGGNGYDRGQWDTGLGDPPPPADVLTSMEAWWVGA